LSLELCDEFDGGFGWTEPGYLERTSHALEVDGAVLVFDPVDAPGIDERIRSLGRPEAVVQLLDRHERDCERVAERLGIPYLRMRLDSSSRGELVKVVWSRVWKEAAFWEPRRRVLVVADALGSVGYFTSPGEAIGVHPVLRLRPPRILAELQPEHILCGHGAGAHGQGAAAALYEALATSRRRLPGALLGGLRRRSKS
jgi:hypothetical protein